MRPARSVFLCTTPRSGSTMLCRLLASTGTVGRPESWFHRPSIERWAETFNVAPDLRTIVAAALRAGSAGGTFGLRLQGGSRDFLMDRLAEFRPDLATDRARIDAVFGPVRYVHLRRDDRVAQAVSRLRAEQSGLWHRAPDGAEIERKPPTRPHGYDRTAIQAHMDELGALDAAWHDWFVRQEIEPVQMRYEDLAADPEGAVRDLIARLDLPLGDPPLLGTAPLADATSRAWAERFRRGA